MRVPAPALVLGSCVSLPVGAACAAKLVPTGGSAGTTLLRLGLAASMPLAVVRPRLRRWDRVQWRAVLVYGATLAAMNGSFYASIARIPLGTAVTIEFLGPLTLAAVLSRRLRDSGRVALAAAGLLLLGQAVGPVGAAAVAAVVLASADSTLSARATEPAGAGRRPAMSG